MSEAKFSYLASELHISPPMLSGAHYDWVASALKAMAEHERFSELMALKTSADSFWFNDDDWRAQFRPYTVEGGILQIPVMGVLLNRMPFQFGTYATGYTYIEKAYERGLEDREVEGIALVCHSPGGEVAGNLELTDKIFETRAEKRSRAFAADVALSAAYSLASATGGISVSRSGAVGSVGIIAEHREFAKMLDDRGIGSTLVYAGEKKSDGHPSIKLSKRAKAAIQASVDKSYAVFTSTVARNRDMTDVAVRATEAGSYDAEDAVEIGFADRVGALDDELVLFAAEVSGELDDQPEDIMTAKTTTTTTTKKDDAGAADGVDTDAIKAEAAKEERARMNAIMDLPEAEGREALARKLATTTGLTADECKPLLEAATKEEAAAPEAEGGSPPEPKPEPTKAAKPGDTHFDKAMRKDNPGVGGDGGTSDDEDDEPAGNRLAASYAQQTGRQRLSERKH